MSIVGELPIVHHDVEQDRTVVGEPKISLILKENIDPLVYYWQRQSSVLVSQPSVDASSFITVQLCAEYVYTVQTVFLTFLVNHLCSFNLLNVQAACLLYLLGEVFYDNGAKVYEFMTYLQLVVVDGDERGGLNALAQHVDLLQPNGEPEF